MSDLADLYERLRAAHWTIVLGPAGTLSLRGVGDVPPELLAELPAARPAILADLLARAQPDEPALAARGVCLPNTELLHTPVECHAAASLAHEWIAAALPVEDDSLVRLVAGYAGLVLAIGSVEPGNQQAGA